MLRSVRESMPGKPKPLDADGLWNYALKILGGHGYSIAQMRTRLSARALNPDDVAGVLSRLKQYGYLNDQRLAESFAAARRENQAQGRFRVLRDLRQKRIAPGVAEQAVSAVYRDTDEFTLAEEFLSRKFRRVRLSEYLADPKHLASAYRRLRLAGFSASVAARLLKKHASEPDLVDRMADEDDAAPET
jgi:regulatory protein